MSTCRHVANDAIANGNEGICLTVLICEWNVVSLTVTSFPAPNSQFWGEWNTPEVLQSLKFQHSSTNPEHDHFSFSKSQRGTELQLPAFLCCSLSASFQLVTGTRSVPMPRHSQLQKSTLRAVAASHWNGMRQNAFDMQSKMYF